MNLEGRVRVSARYGAGRLARVAVVNDRPLVANRLLAGRTPEEALRLLPNVFSVCGRAQSIVAGAAIEAAAGETAGRAVIDRRRRELCGETAAEHAFRLLLDWPTATGGKGEPELLSRLRSLLLSAPESSAAWGAARDAVINVIETRMLGHALDPWLEQFSATEWLQWAAAGGTATAAMLGAFASLPAWASPETRSLTQPAEPRFLEGMGRRALTDPAFCAAPLLDGQPAECGPLARCQMHPAVRDLAWHDRIAARAFARLAEFALLLRDDSAAGWVDSASLGPGAGVAAAEMARGVLVHAVALEGGRIARYAIVAPTEWNFHPAGALPAELEGRPVRSADEGRRAMHYAATTLDPCVALEVELADA
jgi:coenzyme F420-reducing hydrogenase alpha subunit